MPTPLSRAIFENLCRSKNSRFENVKNSSTRDLRGTFEAFTAAIRTDEYDNAKQAVLDAIDALAAAKKTKYRRALNYVRYCLDEDPNLVVYEGQVEDGNWVVREVAEGDERPRAVRRGRRNQLATDNKVAIRYLPGTDHPPAGATEGDPTGSDATAMKSLAQRAAKITRAILYRGTVNNQVRNGENGYEYWCCRNDLPADQREAPKYLNDYNTDLQGHLVATAAEGEIPKQLAGVAYGPWQVKGAGVCAMVAHVTAGVLTMLAPGGTRVAIVVDTGFDHSYTVIKKGGSPWISCDPWPGQCWALPWTPDCWFPPRDVRNCFEFEIVTPVSVPYGVLFTADEIQNALDSVRANNCRTAGGALMMVKCACENCRRIPIGERPRLPRQMDHHYGHPSNAFVTVGEGEEARKQAMPRATALARGYLDAAGPTDWGSAVTVP